MTTPNAAQTAAKLADSTRIQDAKSKYDILMQEYTTHHKLIDEGCTHQFFCKQLQKWVLNIQAAYEDRRSLAANFNIKYKEDDYLKKTTDDHQPVKEAIELVYRHLMQADVADQPDIKREDTEPYKNAIIYKPRTLLHDATISEYNQWKERFRSYYTQNRIANQAPTTQKSFLITCLDDQLVEVIGINADPQATIFTATFGQQTLIQVLDTHFNNLHPLHIRLARITSLDPKPGQTSHSFFQEFIKLTNDAQARTLQAEQILVALMTQKCPNKELRTELLRTPGTLDQALRKGAQYDAASRNSTNASTAATTARKNQAQRTYPSTPNGCYYCNTGPKHEVKACWARDKTCNTCKRKGHIAPACLKAADNKPKKAQSNAVTEGENDSPTLLL